MSERYSRLFSLPAQLYTNGAPVIIEAGTLLKDNQTGHIIAQLKLTNIDDRIIKAVKVWIAPRDTVGRSLGDAITFDYLDLAAKRDDSFGQKNAIRMSDSATRSYQVAVTEVSFDDNSIWSGENTGWEALPGNKNLLEELRDPELVKQYQIKYGAKTDFYPFRTHDLWRCACGVINHERESTCHRCGRSFTDFLSCDLEALSADKDMRLAEEKAAKEKKQAEAAAALVRQKAAAKKKRAIASVAALLIIACVAGYYLTVNFIAPSIEYSKAVTMLNNGDYDGAIAAFQALNGFKDSTEMVEVSQNTKRYDEAVTLMNTAKLDAAYTIFHELGGFLDSAEKKDKVLNLIRQDALNSFDQMDYEKAINRLTPYYSDYNCKQIVDESVQQLFAKYAGRYVADLKKQGYPLGANLTLDLSFSYDKTQNAIIADGSIKDDGLHDVFSFVVKREQGSTTYYKKSKVETGSTLHGKAEYKYEYAELNGVFDYSMSGVVKALGWGSNEYEYFYMRVGEILVMETDTSHEPLYHYTFYKS